MKKKIIVILALILMISVIFCAFAVSAEEIPSDEGQETTEETPAIEGGNWFLENWKPLAEALLGTGGVTFGVAFLAFITKIVELKKKLKETDINNIDIKNKTNELIDEMNNMSAAINTIRTDTTSALAVLCDKNTSVDAKNEAICKTLIALIQASNLPDQQKNYIFGEMNKAVGYKGGDNDVAEN